MKIYSKEKTIIDDNNSSKKEINKLLSEFLGWEPTTSTKKEYFTNFLQPYTNVEHSISFTNEFLLTEMLFEKSWDWLMLVVDKINDITYRKSILYTGLRIYPDVVYINCKGYCLTYSLNSKEVKYKDIKECVYRAVVDYVKFLKNLNDNKR